MEAQPLLALPVCEEKKKGKSKRETVCVCLSIRSQEIADGQWGGGLSYCLYMCVLGLAARVEFNRCTAWHISSLVLFSLLFLYIHLSFRSSIWTKLNFFSFMELQHSSRHEELHQTGWPSLSDQPLSEKKDRGMACSVISPHWSQLTNSIKLRGGLNKFNFWHKKSTYLIFQKMCNKVWKTLLLYLTTECYDWWWLASPSA